jgi:hypothetical protein
MPSFKTKPNKKINVSKKYLTTLDGKHTEFLNEFATDEQNIVPTLLNEKRYCKKMLKKSNLDIEEIMELKDRIIEINENLSELKRKKTNYYLNNSKYIFEYFENKKNIDTNEENLNKPITSKNQILFNIFKIQHESQNTEPTDEMKTQNIVQKYLSNIDESFIDMKLYLKNMDICAVCKIGEMMPLDDEGILICNACSAHIPFLIENEKNSYKEPPKEVCFYSYKKITHFKEIVAQFQGKETTQIPDDHIDLIESQIKKERLQLTDLSYKNMKEILKKLDLNKYYEHIAFIKNKLGISPPVFSQELEETLFNLFMEILAPYSQVCPDDRVNFLNYHFVLFKLLELLDESIYLADIPMLKDPDKIIEQDIIWSKICEIVNWEAIPTV